MLLMSTVLSVPAFPAKAEWQPFQIADSSACRTAVNAVKNRLEQLKRVRVAFTSNNPHGYTRYPRNRPSEFRVALAGDGAWNVLASPVLMKTMATRVVVKCGSIGIVDFGIAQTDAGETYGLMQNGSVEKFQCLSPDDPRADRTLQWGYTICL